SATRSKSIPARANTAAASCKTRKNSAARRYFFAWVQWARDCASLLQAVVIEKVGDGHDRDAVAGQFFTLAQRGRATNGAMLDLALVHAPRLVGKTFADVLGVAHDLAHMLEHLGLDLSHVLGARRLGSRGLGRTRCGSLGRIGQGTPHVQARRGQHFIDLVAIANRARQNTPLALGVVVVCRREPALEDMARLALE